MRSIRRQTGAEPRSPARTTRDGHVQSDAPRTIDHLWDEHRRRAEAAKRAELVEQMHAAALTVANRVAMYVVDDEPVPGEIAEPARAYLLHYDRLSTNLLASLDEGDEGLRQLHALVRLSRKFRMPRLSRALGQIARAASTLEAIDGGGEGVAENERVSEPQRTRALRLLPGGKDKR